jgi:SAM-dependent methyltransferase
MLGLSFGSLGGGVGWMVGLVWEWTVRPCLWLLAAGALWHGGSRWLHRFLARQLLRPSGPFAAEVCAKFCADWLGPHEAWALRELRSRVALRGADVLDLACGGATALPLLLDVLEEAGDDSGPPAPAQPGPAPGPAKASERAAQSRTAAAGGAPAGASTAAATRPRAAAGAPAGPGFRGEPSGSVHLLDWSAEMLEVATKDVGKERLEQNRVHPHLGDVRAMPFADRSFDLVLLLEAAHLFHDLGEVLREVKRVLRPGGCLVLLAADSERFLRERHVQAGVVMGIYTVRHRSALADQLRAVFGACREVRNSELFCTLFVASSEGPGAVRASPAPP